MKPCSNCPFRTDEPPFIRKARAQEIADGLRADAYFACHKTVHYEDTPEEEEDRTRFSPSTRFCTGALIVMKREKLLNKNWTTRFSIGSGLIDPDKLDMTAPVPASLAEWIERHSPTG